MRIITRGLKARDLDLDLGKLSLLRAPNASSKSAVLDAVTFALIGHVPRLGRTAAATAALLRGREMTVRLELDAHWIERTLRRKPKGGFESECRASFCTGTRSEEHEAAVLELVGGSIDEASESLDVGQLIRLTPSQRSARIQELIERGADTDALAVAVARRWMQALTSVEDDRMPADHTALRPLIPGYDDSDDEAHTGEYACLREMAGQMKAKVAEVGIAGALTWANETKRFQTAQLTNKKQAKRELEGRLQEIAEPDPDEIARLEERRGVLDQQIGAASEREAARGRQKSVRSEAEGAHGVAERRAAAARAARQAFEAQAKDLPTWREQLAAIVGELEGLTAPAPVDYAEAEALERQAGEATTAAAAVTVPSVPDMAALTAAVEQAAAALDAAQGSPWARAGAIAAEIRALVVKYGKGRPALVATTETRMDELAELAAANGPGDLDAKIQALTAAQAAAREAEQWLAEATALRDQALSERERHEDAAREATAAAEDLRARLTETYRTERALYASRQAELTGERDRLRALVDGHAGKDTSTAESLAAAERSLTAAAQRLTDLQATTTGEVEPTDTPTATALTAERAQVQQQLGVLTGAQATRAEFRRLVAEIEALEVAETVAKGLERALQRVRADEIAHGAEPLLSIMRQVLSAAGRSEIPFLLGWTNADGDPVSVESLSGSEFALYASALSAAVIIRRSAPRRFLLVEAAEADATSLTQLMRGLGAVADHFTACVVATPHQPASVPAGWVQLAPTGAADAAVAA